MSRYYVDIDRDDYGVIFEQKSQSCPCPTCGHDGGRLLPMQIMLVRKGDGHWSDWPVTASEPYDGNVSLHDHRIARAESEAFARRALAQAEQATS